MSNRVLIAVLATVARATMLSLLAWLLAPAAARAGTVLYSDGAINGNLGSAFINLDDAAADSFVLSSAATLSGVTVGLWSSAPDNPPLTGNPPLTLDWSIWNAPGPGGIGGVALDSGSDAPLSNTFLFENGSADDGIYQSSFALPSISLSAGTYWLELQNAVNPDGDAILWDLNNGPSETWFSLDGIVTAPDCGDASPLEAQPALCRNRVASRPYLASAPSVWPPLSAATTIADAKYRRVPLKQP
jgi:hypothetical protein